MSGIAFKDLTVHYKNRIALGGVSGQFGFNRIVGLTGENGAGKSTLLKALMGDVPLKKGFVEHNGVERLSLKSFRNIHAQLVSQEFQLDRDMRVSSFVVFCAGMAGVSRKEIKKELLRIGDAFGWSELEARSIRKLSGGQKRRVHLIASCLAQPNFLLLDEPFQGLDSKYLRNLLDVMAELASTERRSVVLCSHRIDLLESIVDDVCLMHGGNLLYCGDMKEIPAVEVGTYLGIELGVLSNEQWNLFVNDLNAADPSFPSFHSRRQRIRYVTEVPESVRKTIRPWLEAGFVKSLSEYPPGLEMNLKSLLNEYVERNAE